MLMEISTNGRNLKITRTAAYRDDHWGRIYTCYL